ncbi:class 1 fructose-bisphosphatase [uncultured Methylibium sp.]|uniref:class 1 fructose-bisphosphatase n=1 Tax=uncultured Methylibium sp. TaxID=381093 RepID=UPI0025D6C155|nr:class 1 fructose-bisphosphatase [uncultured Methylibium sp.]
MTPPTDLEQWLTSHPPAVADVVRHVARACVQVSRLVERGTLGSATDEAGAASRVGLADRGFARALADCPEVAGWVSEIQDEVHVSSEFGSTAAYLVAYDALDRIANDDASTAAGSVFSVLPHLFRGTPASAAAFMQPGRRQVAAGYAIYGPTTQLVLSLGEGVQVFTLDPDRRSEAGRWILTGEAVRVPKTSAEFAIDASNQRFWEKPVQRYVAECVAGQGGPRGRDFGMHWLGSLVGEMHRVLTRGGVYLQPRDSKEPYRPGHLCLLHEAAPLAWLMERAGAAASNGTTAIVDLVPDALHQKVPLILGSRDEVERIVGYHADPSENVSWQLFKTRSLFIQPNV